MKTRLLIQCRSVMPHWEDFAHPKDDIEAAIMYLEDLRIAESKKKYPLRLRLIRETVEVIG